MTKCLLSRWWMRRAASRILPAWSGLAACCTCRWRRFAQPIRAARVLSSECGSSLKIGASGCGVENVPSHCYADTLTF